MSTAELFLSSYSRIEKHLRAFLSVGHEVSFYKLIDLGAARLAPVRYFQTDLREFADLRNAIVHERTDNHVIAEPLEHTAHQLEYIAALLTQPPSLLKVAHNPVASITIDEPVALAIAKMTEASFSQLPVVSSNGCEAVLTPNTITRWLGASRDVGIVSIDDTPVREVLAFQEPTECHRFFASTASIFDVLEAFQVEHAQGRALTAILVTPSGKSKAALQGIITLSDLPAAYALLTTRS